MGIDKLFSSLQEETDRMADAVDKVFDETDKVLDGIEESHLSAEDEAALDSQLELGEKVSATIAEAEESKNSFFDKLKMKFRHFLPHRFGDGF